MANYQTLLNVNNFESLIEYLRDELDWDFQAEDIDDLTFDYEPEELGLDEATAAKIGSIKQLRPMAINQPWGIFSIDFGRNEISVTAMRQLLRGLVKRKRESDNDSDRQRFALSNLLFILTSEGYSKFDFASFRGKETTRATLSIFGWRKGDTHLRTLVEHNLPKLKFPIDTNDDKLWIKQWNEAFDVEKVTDNFFNDYKATFFKTENALKISIPDQKTADKEAQEMRRVFAQRLFNRLMFIYFLQKKGWLSFEGDKNYLQVLFAKAEAENENFYSRRLHWLFFSGLGSNENQDLHNVSYFRERRGDVPYLNGGLFELEKDGFDDDGKIELPNKVFADILEFFSKYNFTVEESTPLDVQVAVDPEMLGKIFEKVITEREIEKGDRKSKGRYYTPRYVVSFMYREALKHFLAETDVDRNKIRKLVDKHESDTITISEAKTLLDKLDQLKIVDPACGSGAYLLGCLQELFIIRQKLDTRSGEATSKDDYHRKLRIIQQNIYGVDLDNYAVQIARLRLWLSLVVDFEGDTPEPLPNLNFKIEQGDSLTSPNPNDTQGSLFRDIIREFAEAKSAFFLLVDEHGKPVSSDEKDRRLKNTKEKRENLQTEIAKWRSVRHSATAQGFDWQVDFGEVFLNGGFDIVLANPPFGAESSDKTLREKFFGKGTTQSKDTYGLFIARGLELLRPNGTLCFIVSDTWRTIKSHKPLRRRILEETTVKHFIDLPSWVFDATVNTNILTVSKIPASADHTVIAGDLHNLPKKDWNALYKNLEAVAEHGFDAQTLTYARYTYPQSLISTYENLSFFVASPKLYGLMSDSRFVKFSSIADVKVGLQTSDNPFYLRKRNGVRGTYEILDESKLLIDKEITNLSDDEEKKGINPQTYGGKHFLPYDKGGESDSDLGWLPNYYVPTGYFIDWSKDAVENLRTRTIFDVKTSKGEINKIQENDENKIAAVFRNPQFYFTYGITFSPTGIYSPTFRIGCGAIFGNKGSTIFSKKDTNVILGILSSTFARYLLKSYLSHTVETGEDVLKKLVLPKINSEIESKIKSLVSTIIEKQKTNQYYPYHLHEQKEIDAIVYELYGLDADDIQEVEIWYCRRYEKLSKAQGFWAKVETKYADYLEHREIILSKSADYWNEHPIKQIIAKNEGSTIEFKEKLENSTEENTKENGVNKVLRAVCSFLNAEGGTVLIGVNDKSLEIVGIDAEILELKLTKDSYELKIRQMIEDSLKPKIIGNDLISLNLEPTPNGYVCKIEVKPSREPVFYKDRHLFVRYGNKTQKLEGVAMTKWLDERKSKFK
jgi:type I restriction-modification system DNA methylase subunit